MEYHAISILLIVALFSPSSFPTPVNRHRETHTLFPPVITNSDCQLSAGNASQELVKFDMILLFYGNCQQGFFCLMYIYIPVQTRSWLSSWTQRG